MAGGGKLVLGQEQDRIGGGFSESESLIGRVHRLDVWDYMLSSSEIMSLARECTPSPDGSVVRWTDFLTRIRGRIMVSDNQIILSKIFLMFYHYSPSIPLFFF